MIGLLMRGMFGSFFSIPCAILGGLAAVLGICGCIQCARCRLRDCACCKRLLRAIGHDSFDDFELVVMAHEAIFEKKEAKFNTKVRLTAGRHSVSTDYSSKSIFQQPLHLTVEQGTDHITVDLLDHSSRVLATLTFNCTDILDPKSRLMEPEMMHNMVQKGKGVRNPKIKLTINVSQEIDAEKGLLSGVSQDVDLLVRQQLRKAKEEGISVAADGQLSEMDVLKQACAGPLELFEGLGKTANVHVAVQGPPSSRRWMLGIFHDKREYDANKAPFVDIDLLRVQGVQADPTRHHVFVINYFDESKVRHTLSFRRIDRARDVWVEILHILVQKAHESHKEYKEGKRKKTPSGAASEDRKTKH